MKKMTKDEISNRLNESSQKTGYEYTFTGLETQKDKIKVFCPIHKYSQLQSREYTFQARKIKCCNDNSPLTIEKYNEKIKKFDTINIKIEMMEEFNGNKTKIKITCLKHNHSRIIKIESLFYKKSEHICNKCSHEIYNRNHTYNKDIWIEKANKIHNDKYDYSKMEDTGLNRTIICKKHGEFSQNIHNHIYLANGCPKCVIMPSVSNGENELKKYFDSLGLIENIDYIRNDRSAINPKELDFYFPKLNVAFEYNGNYWHSFGKKGQYYHKDKKLLGLSKNINIIMIYEHDWINKNQIIKNRIKSILKKDVIIFARKLQIKEVIYKDAKKFCLENHLQGWTISSFNYGLYNDNILVALMTFGKSRFTDHEYELLRYVSKDTIVGGASRLLSHFIKIINPKNIISYADMDWSCGNLYKKLNFKQISITDPGYVWIKGNKVLSRYQTQIKNENDIMTSNGFIKVYKCGSIKFLWHKIVDI